MKNKLIAMTVLSVLLTSPGYAFDPNPEADRSDETTYQFNTRLNNNQRPFSRQELYVSSQYEVQKQTLIELKKVRCLLEKMDGQPMAEECQPKTAKQ